MQKNRPTSRSIRTSISSFYLGFLAQFLFSTFPGSPWRWIFPYSLQTSSSQAELWPTTQMPSCLNAGTCEHLPFMVCFSVQGYWAVMEKLLETEYPNCCWCHQLVPGAWPLCVLLSCADRESSVWLLRLMCYRFATTEYRSCCCRLSTLQSYSPAPLCFSEVDTSGSMWVYPQQSCTQQANLIMCPQVPEHKDQMKLSDDCNYCIDWEDGDMEFDFTQWLILWQNSWAFRCLQSKYNFGHIWSRCEILIVVCLEAIRKVKH